MTQRGGDVWLGDVIAAWSDLLGPTEEIDAATSADTTRRASIEAQVARLLGFALVKRVKPELTPRISTVSSPTESTEGADPSPMQGRTPRPRQASAVRTTQAPDDSSVRRMPAPWGRRLSPVGFELDASTDPDGPELEAATTQQTRGMLPHAPLISAHTLPAVLHAALGTDAGDGDIDIELLIPLIATREPIASIPYESRPSLLRGVQLLIDVGPGLGPFRRDARHLARAVTRLVGVGQTQELWFDRSPLEGVGRGPQSSWSRGYKPPPPRTPVLLVTDLGIAWTAHGLGASPEEWLTFVAILRMRGSCVVALVPYPPSRWPASLASVIPIIHWDRPTGVGDVRRAVGSVLGGHRA